MDPSRGDTVGVCVGALLAGANDVLSEGVSVRMRVGSLVGNRLPCGGLVGENVGSFIGALVVVFVGSNVDGQVGAPVASGSVGAAVGTTIGERVGYVVEAIVETDVVEGPKVEATVGTIFTAKRTG